MAEVTETKPGSDLRTKWSKIIAQRERDFGEFRTDGDRIIEVYRIEKKSKSQRDKYNILYANTETIKPALYAQTPKVEVKQRQADQNNPMGRVAGVVLETSVSYVIDEQSDGFDDVIGSCVEDLLLPGFGQAWVRYEPTMQPMMGHNGGPLLNDNEEPQEEVAYSRACFDYVHWKDFLWSKGRRWSEVWWVSRASWMDKEAVTKRFGEEIAKKISFTGDDGSSISGKDKDIESQQIRVHEIWDKKNKKAIWYSESYADDVLDVKDDPLKLDKFFPCPKPLFAITTTGTSVPRPYYAQYQAQAEELNDITYKIRLLVDALRVVGIYDGSMPELKTILNTNSGNRMIPVDGWATVQDKGGLKGVTDFMSLTDIVTALMQLYDARERVKNEIYEITGWSDIIRGVSKASETLGAQKLKSDWAGSRLKLMQKDVQRFIRDLFRIAGEIIAEHFDEGTLALACGLPYAAENDELRQMFAQVCQLLKKEKQRCNLISVETDSTLLPDETNDRAERMEFVAAAGAFLQQAVPAAAQTPALGPLLGSILMFAIRSFRSARPLEQEFEKFTQAIAQQPPQQPGQEGKTGEDGQSKVQAAMMAAQGVQDTNRTKLTIAQMQTAQDDKEAGDKLQFEMEKERNRHDERMAELRLEMARFGLEQQSHEREDLQMVHGMQTTNRQEDRADREPVDGGL